MRSHQTGYAPYLGIFLRELEDKLDVARMQQKVFLCFIISDRIFGSGRYIIYKYTIVCFQSLTDTRYHQQCNEQSTNSIRFHDSEGCKIEVEFFVARHHTGL